MRSRVFLLLCGLFAALVTITGLFAPLSAASAQELAVADCAHREPTEAIKTNPLRSNGGYLLTRDGTGFFTGDISSVAVRSAASGHDSAATPTEAVVGALVDFYFGSKVEIFANSPGKSTRAVVVDDEISVPGQPTVFTIGGVQTLYLHRTTADSDIARLLDIPSFKTLLVADDTDQDCLWSAAGRALTEPSHVLAYVDDEPGATDSILDALADTPLADSAPKTQFPFPIAAAAALVATGGVVLHRRDKIWGDRYAPSTQPVETLIEETSPVPGLAPEHPRVIFLDEADQSTDPAHAKPVLVQRQIDLHAKKAESPLTRMVEKIALGYDGPLVTRPEFARQVHTEWSRFRNGGIDGAVASLVLSEVDAVRLRLGNHAAEELFAEVTAHIAEISRPLDVIGLAGDDELAILMPDISENQARDALDDIAKKIASMTFRSNGERVLLTPATGFAMLSDTDNAPDLIRAVESARSLSMLNLHLNPERWDGNTEALHTPKDRSAAWATIKAKLRTPAQIGLTLVISWVLPFCAYIGLAAIGLDISWLMYLFLVVSLVITGTFILAEGLMAIRQKEPPEVPAKPYPKASALIAAYMPNEAATIIETIEAFLAMDYPNELQIILAYNTPDPLPVEEHLDRIAAEHPNFVPVRIVGSNSKAQNVNAALSMAEGEFIGMFDADHQPRPDAFTRAWRWIDDGYDVVQGHCLTRNGDAGWLAAMIAVEFEGIYAVAHPGRAKMHRFAVFGGSNGFWRTELLHETRMRGSMLTEDIDSSMRVVGRGYKIRSDRDLVSRELATTTFQQIWNQRMRWAQGWVQVSMEHVKLAYRSKDLTVRQKLGIVHLLMWREVYPWLSQQLWPLLAFWAVRAGGVGQLDWTVPIFVATSIFTFSVGPLQTVFTYKLADPEIKQHKLWFWGYLLFTTFFYTEYKNLIARVAHVKQFMGESDWRVTPRSTDPAS